MFPLCLQNLHPFYSTLMNVLYNTDHYKLALGGINKARQLIDELVIQILLCFIFLLQLNLYVPGISGCPYYEGHDCKFSSIVNINVNL